ncbi:MAG: hypothetical protein ABL982_00340 [Vicinamibacterales bacterium]
MTSANTTRRARLAEDDYFRRKDAELMEPARLTRRQTTVDRAARLTQVGFPVGVV